MLAETEALIACLVDIERSVRRAGWDQPVRLFSLVSSQVLLESQPHLEEALGLSRDVAEDHLSAIEQDEFHSGLDLGEALARIAWPELVLGCAVAVERRVLPEGAEISAELTGAELVKEVASHPDARDVRLVSGVTRSGAEYGLVRVRDDESGLVSAPNLLPGLTRALLSTFDA